MIQEKWDRFCEETRKKMILRVEKTFRKEKIKVKFELKKYWKTEFIPKGQSLHVENIDRMEFPFWCWYLIEPVSKRTFGRACYKRVGMVNKVSDSLYILFEAEKQTKGSNFVDGSESLLD